MPSLVTQRVQFDDLPVELRGHLGVYYLVGEYDTYVDYWPAHRQARPDDGQQAYHFCFTLKGHQNCMCRRRLGISYMLPHNPACGDYPVVPSVMVLFINEMKELLGEEWKFSISTFALWKKVEFI